MDQALAVDDVISLEHWVAPSGALWQMWVHWARTDGRAEPVRLVIETATTPATKDAVTGTWQPGDTVTPLGGELSPLNATDLRSLPLAKILRDARRNITASSTARAKGDKTAESRRHNADRAKVYDRRKGKKISDDELREVAAIYREVWALRGNPVDAVAERLHMNRSTAGKRVMAARDKGHLPPTQRGKASA